MANDPATTIDNAAKRKELSQRIRVRATRMGYYMHVRRREGDVFSLIPQNIIETVEEKDLKGRVVGNKKVSRLMTAREQFSARWMEEVEPQTPGKVTTGKQDLKAKHDDLIKEKFGLGGEAADDDPGAGDAGGGDHSGNVL